MICYIWNEGMSLTVMGQLPETSVIHNASNQKSIIDYTLRIILENYFEKLRFNY